MWVISIVLKHRDRQFLFERKATCKCQRVEFLEQEQETDHPKETGQRMFANNDRPSFVRSATHPFLVKSAWNRTDKEMPSVWTEVDQTQEQGLFPLASQLSPVQTMQLLDP